MAATRACKKKILKPRRFGRRSSGKTAGKTSTECYTTKAFHTFRKSFAQSSLAGNHDSLAGHFGIENTSELVARKYYWSILRPDVEEYVKGFDVCLASKAVRQAVYSLPVLTHQWKDLSMDFVMGLPVSTDWKGDSHDSILVIIDRLTKMVHHEPVQVSINAPSLAELINDVVVRHPASPTRSSLIGAQFPCPNSGYCCVISLASNAGSPPPAIRRTTARPRGRTA